MRRLRSPWVWFALAAAAVFGAFGWLSWALLRLESREADARAEAQFHESVRLALWRMDSALAPFLAQEAARPYFHYLAFYSPDRGYSRMLRPLSEGEVYVPSPLLAGEPEFCLLHFQMDEQGRLSSPRAPTGNLLDLAESEYVASACVQQAGDLLAALSAMPALADLTPEKARKWTAQRQNESAQLLEETRGAQDARSPQQQRAAMDLAQRQQVGQSLNSSPYALANALPPRGDANIEQSDLTPVWIDSAEGEPELLLIRTVRTGSESILQGVWIDWPALSASLLARTEDLLPEAQLAPAPPAPDVPAEPGLRLAGIPALLHAGETPPPPAAAGLTPTRTVLLIGWLALVAAVASIALVLRLVTDMNARRARFVSAVTHELRTPLTTFCLYSQMLADGMVRDEQKRADYLATLKRESGRLARLVENVLAYARLTDLRARVHADELPLAETLQRLTERLEPSVIAAGMRLEIDAAARDCRVRADAETLERILGNLLENACKYAGGEAVADKRILIQATCAGGNVEIVVRDYGPGVPADMQRRIFAAFERGRDEATAHRPGLGLGLSLARSLARECGGDLALRRCEGAGAAFVLTLPAA